MTIFNNYEVWFVIGSQHLYGPEALQQVTKHAEHVVNALNAEAGDFVRRRAQRLQHQFARQFGFRVQRVNDVLRVFRHLLQRLRSVQMLDYGVLHRTGHRRQ